jgi:hypothetical protein
MPMPAVLSKAGSSGTVVWTPDWMQDPFVIGISLIGTIGTASIDGTFDDPNGAATPNWFPVIAAAALTTATLATARFSTPCQGLRLNVSSAVATTIVTATFVQATFPR